DRAWRYAHRCRSRKGRYRRFRLMLRSQTIDRLCGCAPVRFQMALAVRPQCSFVSFFCSIGPRPGDFSGAYFALAETMKKRKAAYQGGQSLRKRTAFILTKIVPGSKIRTAAGKSP